MDYMDHSCTRLYDNINTDFNINRNTHQMNKRTTELQNKKYDYTATELQNFRAIGLQDNRTEYHCLKKLKIYFFLEKYRNIGLNNY